MPPNHEPFTASSSNFPPTRYSVVRSIAEGDVAERSRALNTLMTLYWKPVYKYVRLRWNKTNQDAEDLTQAFFVSVLEKDFLESYNPAKARFRTFFRVCLDRFLSKDKDYHQRLKRGGGQLHVSLSFDDAERELQPLLELLPDHQYNPDDIFEKDWVKNLLSLALDRLETEYRTCGKEIHFTIFQRYDICDDDISYAEMAQEYALKPTDVTNYLAAARRRFRQLTLDLLRELTASEEEFQEEVRLLSMGEQE